MGLQVFLEIGASLCLLGLFFVPMLPVPQHILLHHYFTWLRIPSTMLVLLPAPASDLQGTEPLPRWAVASRIFHQPALVTLGVMCYGEVCPVALFLSLWGFGSCAATAVAQPGFFDAHRVAVSILHTAQVSTSCTGHSWSGLAIRN